MIEITGEIRVEPGFESKFFSCLTTTGKDHFNGALFLFIYKLIFLRKAFVSILNDLIFEFQVTSQMNYLKKTIDVFVNDYYTCGLFVRKIGSFTNSSI